MKSHRYICVNEFNIIKIRDYSAKMALLGKGRVKEDSAINSPDFKRNYIPETNDMQ